MIFLRGTHFLTTFFFFFFLHKPTWSSFAKYKSHQWRYTHCMMYFCASSIVQQIVILIIHLLWGGGVHPLYGREGGGGGNGNWWSTVRCTCISNWSYLEVCFMVGNLTSIQSTCTTQFMKHWEKIYLCRDWRVFK